MEQIRIGNDIHIAWSVFSHRVVDGAGVVEPYDLTGKDIKLEAYNSIRKEIIPIQSVEGNVISTIFYGKNQKYAGEYTLTLVENDGKENMHTIDACSAFKLVRRTCELESCTCGDNDNIEVYSLKLSSSFDVGVIVDNGTIVVDAELSLESENAVQNKVITEALGGKQDSIADLDAIRQGAEKGATALQEEQFKGTYSLPEGGIPKDDLSQSVQESLGKADTALQEHQSLEDYATKKELESYVEKKDGYGLSQEDFTTTLKNKLSGLENYDDAEVQAAIEALGARLDALVGTSASEAIDTFNEIVEFLDGVEDTATLEGIIADIGKQISAVEAKIPTDYVKPSELANVATSGSYADLKDKPTIPDAVTEQTVSGWGFTKNEGTVTSIAINGENKTPDASGAVDIGAVLTEHQSLKTINGESIVGTGNITIEGGGGAMPLNIISGLPYDATVAPNTAVLAPAWMGSFNVSLTAPTDTSIMNTYVVALADLGGGSLSFDKDIKWVNDDIPVFEGDGTLLEMCITYYHGNYVGVWGRSRGDYSSL